MLKAYRAESWMIGESVERAFRALSEQDQALAIAAAPAYRGEIAKTGVHPKTVKNWLREGIFRSYAAEARSRLNGRHSGPTVFVAIDSPQWDEWRRYRLEHGGQMPNFTSYSDEHRANGWWFQSEWPPTDAERPISVSPAHECAPGGHEVSDELRR
jgi:hypothetical protein